MGDVKVAYEIRYIRFKDIPKATVAIGDIDKFLSKLTSMGFLVTECKPIIKRRNKNDADTLLRPVSSGEATSENRTDENSGTM